MIVKIKDIECNVEIIIKRRNKNIYLRVRDNKIYITTPSKLSSDYIEKMILKNYDYILKLLNKPALNKSELHFLGKAYKLEIIESAHNNLLCLDDTIAVFTRKKEDSYIQRIIHSFYAKELEKIVTNYIDKIKSDFKINFEIIFQYKNVKTYFGECYHKRRLVILATKLAKYDLIYILSVIYHELGHFYYQNHSMHFYMLLEQLFPSYRKIQRNLKKIKYYDMY